MAIPSKEALAKFYDWWYERNRETIEKQVVDAMLFGKSYASMAMDQLCGVQAQPWHEIFREGRPANTYVEEPVNVFGFGEGPMSKNELHDRWDKIGAPRNCEELVKLLSDYKEPTEMFFALDGMPRAYTEIPTGFSHSGDYRMPPVMRVVYRVLAYKKQLRDGEDGSGVEAELVECFWRDMVYVRKVMDDTFGGTPILFWRRRPEFTIEQEEGDNARFARFYARLDVPGFDWNKYPVYSHLGTDGISKPAPAPVSEAKKEEIRLADEVLKLSQAASFAQQEHINAFQRLVDLRSKNHYYSNERPEKTRFFDPTSLYGAGVLGDPQVQQARSKTTAALRQVLDAQAMASNPDGVALTSCAHPDAAATAEERERQDRIHRMQQAMGSLDSAAGHKKQV